MQTFKEFKCDGCNRLIYYHNHDWLHNISYTLTCTCGMRRIFASNKYSLSYELEDLQKDIIDGCSISYMSKIYNSEVTDHYIWTPVFKSNEGASIVEYNKEYKFSTMEITQ